MRIHIFVASARQFIVGVALTLAGLPALLSAQVTTPTSKDDPRPVARAATRVDAVTIDGRLDDAGWAAAQPITDFHQQSPDEGKAPTERTELRILYDANAIYVAARMFDSQGPSAVRKLLVRRDQLLNDTPPTRSRSCSTRITTARRGSGSSSIHSG